MMSVCTGCGGKKPWRLVQCKKCEAAELERQIPQFQRKRSQYVNVYCITSGELGSSSIKFGIADVVSARLAQLQAGSPLHLRVVGNVKARRILETRILKHLDQHNCWGEWFHPHPEVVAMARRFELCEWDLLLGELWEKPTRFILEATSQVA